MNCNNLVKRLIKRILIKWLGKMNNNSNVVIFIYIHEQVKCTQSTNKRHTYLAKPISRLSN